MNTEYLLEREKEELIHNKLLEYIRNYDRFIMKTVLTVKRKCKRLECDDIKQQIYLILFTSCKSIDLNKTEKFSTYFSSVVINAANNIVKKYWQEKNKINIESVSLDAYYIENNEFGSEYITFVKEAETTFLSPENYYQTKELEENILNFKKYLSVFEKKVFVLYLKGEPIEKIASRYKKSKKTIYNVLTSIKEKIKKQL